MKNYIYILITSFFFTACTEEIYIDNLDNINTKLVIEANINIDKNVSIASKTQTIKLSSTTSYYSNIYPAITGATIAVTDKNGTSMGTFLDVNPGIIGDTADGTYTAIDFTTPTINETYYISVTVNGETYTAQDTFTGIVDINTITQETITFPQEFIQINVNIDNEIDVDNYYFFKVNSPIRVLPEYGVGDDQQLNETLGENNYDFVYLNEETKKDFIIDFTVYGVSKNYANYLNKILTLSQGSGGGPFTTAPASIRGNILNTSNKENYALGFFSVNQFVKTNYIVK